MIAAEDRLQIVLLLAVFASPKDKPPTLGDIGKNLVPLLEHAHGKPGAKKALEAAAGRAGEEGMLQSEGSSHPRFRLTAAGEQLLQERFGGELKRGRWATLRDRLLFPLAGNVAAHPLPRDFRITRAAILAEALGFGEHLSRAKTEAQILNRALAAVAGARADSPAALSKAMVRSWLDDSSKSADGASIVQAIDHHPPDPLHPTTPELRHLAPERQLDMDAFAQTVTAAARDVARRDDTPKAFISRVWADLEERGTTFGLDAERYREALLQAHRSGLLRLSVAALGPSYDQNDMAASELHWLSETFHFIDPE
jgi:hypothetical protein